MIKLQFKLPQTLISRGFTINVQDCSMYCAFHEYCEFIDEVARGVNVQCGRLRKIKRKYSIKTDSDIATTSEILKQKIQLKAQTK